MNVERVLTLLLALLLLLGSGRCICHGDAEHRGPHQRASRHFVGAQIRRTGKPPLRDILILARYGRSKKLEALTACL